MLKVYQIHLNDSEITQLQMEGWQSPNLKIRAYGARSFVKSEAVDLQFYDLVAEVDTNDMEEAFELMNLWEHPERVTKIGSPNSMSVGDVLENEAGELFLCASFGFERI
jgi:hypothetical protein